LALARRRWNLAWHLAAFLAAALSLASQAATASTIDFDGSPAPCVFSDTTALRSLASAPGVHFEGPAELAGGAILDECSGFQVAPHSGDNFLAFNRGAMFEEERPRDAQTIRFDDPISSFSIWASGGETATQFQLTARGAGDSLLESVTIDVGELAWAQLAISSLAISSVVLQELGELGANNTFAYDTLTYTSTAEISIPEPGTAVLLGLAGAGLLFARTPSARRARSQGDNSC